MRINIFIAFLFILWLSSCIDPFNPEINGNGDGQLVIEGRITDQPGQHRVNISKTRSYNDPNGAIPDQVSGARVQISDDEGNVFELAELTAGVYATKTEVQGVVGRTYQLKVTYQGEEYSSEPELLTPSSEPASIGARFTREFVEEGTGEVLLNRVLFYLDVNKNKQASDYYKYSIDFTYEIESPFWQTPDACGDNTLTEITPKICYVSEEPDVFLNILSLKGYAGARYQEHYVGEVDANRRFMSKFSIRIRQYSMTEQAYQYWENVQAQRLRTGSLFDPPPSRIPGNIQSVSKPDEAVLGYFMASSEKEIRSFFSPEVLEAELENFNGCDCFPEPTIKCMGVVPPDGFVLPPPRNYCCDCREYPNSTAEKPSFWTD